MTDSASAFGPSDAAVKLARVESLIPAIRKSLLSSLLSIAIFGALLFPYSPVGLAAWLGVRAVASAASIVALRRLTKAATSAERSINVLAVIMALSGIVWGLIPLLIRPAEPEWRAVVVLWLFGNQSVVTVVCSPSRPVFRAAIGSVTIVGAASSLLYGDWFGLVLAAILLLGGVYSQSIFGAMHQMVNGSIEARLVASSLATSLTEQQAKLETANEALTYLASRDELTGLLNRRSFIEMLVDDRSRLIDEGWLAYIDLDMFKAVNDTHGHAAGDRILVIAAERWQAALPDGGVLARIGGDEFAAWFTASSSEEAQRFAEGLNDCLTSPIAIPNGPLVHASSSIGVTRASAGEFFAAAAARADRSLYSVKDQGRNDVGMTEAPDRPDSSAHRARGSIT